MVRMGASSALTSESLGDFRIMVASLGYSYGVERSHAFNVALERRSFSSGTRETFASLSYSIQR